MNCLLEQIFHNSINLQVTIGINVKRLSNKKNNLLRNYDVL